MTRIRQVLITGAAGNLGKAVVDNFLKNEYFVIATVSPGKKGEIVQQNNLEIVEADLTDEDQTTGIVTEIVTRHSGIDVALLLVGGFASGGIKETDGALMRKMYALNFETAWFVVRPVFLQMVKQSEGGRIVLVGSRPSLQPADGAHALAYSMSKSLLFKLAEVLNSEGASHNVVTSVVVPSTIDTPANRKGMPNADFSKWVSPQEIAEVMYFIATSKSLREPVYKVYGNA